MYDTCPVCKYDLSGLNRELVSACPECGANISHLDIVQELSRQRRRVMWWYFLGPLIALPGCGAYLIGQPILCMIICTACAFRSLLLDDRIRDREPMVAASLVQAMLLAAAWTVTGTAILALTAAMVATVIGHYRHG